MPINVDQLLVDETLGAEQFVTSTDGRFTFVYQGDGNLVLYRNYRNWERKYLWDSGTDGTQVDTCIMQGDGNLVIYGPGWRPLWASDTNGNPGSRLVVQNDGNVVINCPDGTRVWATNTAQADRTAPLARGYRMQSGARLDADHAISSPDGRYTFIFQGDGNLVLYRNSDGRPLWASNTWGTPAEVCLMQGDGNLVIYHPDGRPLWASGTDGNSGSRLVVQNDGNVAIYRPDGTRVWATNTVQHDATAGPSAHGNTMLADQTLGANQFVTSSDGRFTFVYQGDGNLVLYRNYGKADQQYLWDSGTNGTPVGTCIMQGDGNLVIYGPDGRPLWASGTDGNPGSRLVVQNDGNVVIYRPDAEPIWGTGLVIRRGRIPDLDNASVTVKIFQDGAVWFQGHVYNGGWESVAFRVRVLVRAQDTAIAMAYQGHAGGLGVGSDDSRDEYWEQTSENPMVGSKFEQFRTSRLEIHSETSGDVTGWLEDVGSFLARQLVSAVLLFGTGPLLTLIVVGVEVGSLVTGGGFGGGARIIGGTLWLVGPEGTLFALISEGVAKLGSKERLISQAEYDWANDAVFRGTLPPRDCIVLTDTLGGGGRPFVYPRYDGKITVNLGENLYARPLDSNNKNKFVHELVHVWQLHNIHGELVYMGNALVAQVCKEFGEDPYLLPPGIFPFAKLNLEQQAHAVEAWFAGGLNEQHKYYPYVRDNIRTGSEQFRQPYAFDLVSDFAATKDQPGGRSVFSYGYTVSPGSVLLRYSAGFINDPLPLLNRFTDGVNDCPVIIQNNTGGSSTYVGTITQPADMLNLHPGPAGQCCVVRFIAPAAGTYRVVGVFQGLDFGYGQTNTNVGVLLNSNASKPLFSGNVVGFGTKLPFDFTVRLNDGDILDFFVGFGGNGYYSDSTGLKATITGGG